MYYKAGPTDRSSQGSLIRPESQSVMADRPRAKRSKRAEARQQILVGITTGKRGLAVLSNDQSPVAFVMRLLLKMASGPHEEQHGDGQEEIDTRRE